MNELKIINEQFDPLVTKDNDGKPTIHWGNVETCTETDDVLTMWCQALMSVQDERNHWKSVCDDLYDADPCPKCGCGITGECWGCLYKAEKKRADKLQALADNLPWKNN